MAVKNMPATAVMQPDEGQERASAGGVTYSQSYEDAYATLKGFADTVGTRDILGNGGPLIIRYSLRRRPGGRGILTLVLAPDDTTTGENAAQAALLETWSLRSVRNDVSLFAYCGPSEGNDANRVRLELWLKETDATLAAAMKYRRNDEDAGTELTQADQALAEKFLKGYDSVIRVYPLLTKKRVYSRMPSSVYENLCTVDTPAVTDSSKEKETPGNLAGIISAHSWLKVQDDLEKNADGTFSRVEAWMGVLTSERTWDENLYGSSSRWPMPYSQGG